mgnify:CR=1 FL=1
MGMTAELTIKKATAHDADVLAKLGADTFYHTFRPHNTEADMQAYITKAYASDVVLQNLIQKDIAYYLCYDGLMPVGYIKLLHNATYGKLQQQCIELEKIYILHTYFGTSTATLLMQQAIAHAKQAGFKTLFLGVWQENERAVAFYKKMGFEVFDTRQFKLGSRLCEDFMMKLEL